MRNLPLLRLVAAFFGLGLFTACTDLGVGRTCLNPNDGGVTNGVKLSSPALECPSRLCLLTGANGMEHDLCTAPCTTNDDCSSGAIAANAAAPMGQCASNFVCAVATVAGPFCCKSYCICRDDLVQGLNTDVDGGAMNPPSCVKGQSDCTNL